MAKKGGRKRKIPIEKISKKDYLATCHTKRIHGLFSKASQLCLLSGSQMAILATPPSSNSSVSFHSFGHSSVDSIVSAFLAGKPPLPVTEGYNREAVEDILARKDLGLDLWWEDESLARSDNPAELMKAMDSMSRILRDFKELKKEMNNKSDVVVVPMDQTLNLQSDCNNTEEHDQTLAICGSFGDTDNNALSGTDTEMDFDQLINSYISEIDTSLVSNSEANKKSDVVVPLDQALNLQSVCNNTEEQDQILAICGSFGDTDNNALTGTHTEMDFDQLIDLESPEIDTSLVSNSEANDVFTPNMCSGGLVFQRAWSEDDLRFSDFFSDIAAAS